MRISRLAAAAGVVAATACREAPTFMRAAGAPGDAEAVLGWWLTATAAAVVVVVCVLLVVAPFRRGPLPADEHALAHEREEHLRPGLNWIHVGLALTVLVLIATFTSTMVTLARTARPPSRPALTLDIDGHQWWWEVRYQDSIPGDAFVTANEIHIPVGEPVALRVHTSDVIHSFWIPELAGKIDLVPGQLNESWILAHRAGRYRGQCAEYCGLQHAEMAIELVAEPPGEFAAWAANQRKGQNPSVDPGARTFVQTCSGCHAIRGTEALGRYGPDLTHLASRATIGAGVLPNNAGSLVSWITNAQASKPGSKMPPLDVPSDRLPDLVQYLQTLK